MIRIRRLLACCFVACVYLSNWSAIQAADSDLLTYIGGEGSQQLRTVLPLSDGTVLIGGGADSLSWLPPAVPATVLSGSEKFGSNSGKVAFLLHASQDLKQLLRVVSLPPGAAVDVRAIKSTNLPGAKTGALYLSGLLAGDKATIPRPDTF